MASGANILVASVGHSGAAQVTTTRTPCSLFYVQAASGNSAAVYFGDSTTNASSAIGLYIPAPATNVPSAPIGPFSTSGADSINLTDFYADSSSASQKLIILYVVQ